MQVVSGAIGRERVHYQAPAASRLNREMRAFLGWFNGRKSVDVVLKAGIAHLWFVTIHPFDDGNGRIPCNCRHGACAVGEQPATLLQYVRANPRGMEGLLYYDILETTQKGGLEITDWLEWFLGCLDRAFEGAETILASVLKKARFWEMRGGEQFNERQRTILNLMLDGFAGKLTS